MPILSVLIPVYNAGKFIKRCLDSIVSQKQFDNNIEIIIINDGSKDDSLLIIDYYAKVYNNIHVITRENRGIGQTRNELIDSCNGQYFWFIDADDYISPESLRLILEQLLSQKYDLITFGYNWITSQGTTKITYRGIYRTGIEAVLNKIFNNALWIKVYRTSIIRKNNIRFNSFSMGEDFDFIFRATTCLGEIYCIEDFLYNYIENPTSAVSNISKEHRLRSSEDSLKCIKANMEHLYRLDNADRAVMLWPLEYFCIAYMYSLYLYPFGLKYKLNCFARLESYKIFPLHSSFDSKKLNFFKRIINVKLLRKISVYCNYILLKLN